MPSARVHGWMFLAAVFLLGLAAVYGGGSLPARVTSVPVQDIAVRHRVPSSLSIVRAARPGAEMIEFRTGSEQLEITVPATWALREVRGTTLADVRSTPEPQNFLRWTVPANARVSFLTDGAQHLMVHGTGTGSLLVKVTQLDLETERTVESSILLKEEPTRVW